MAKKKEEKNHFDNSPTSKIHTSRWDKQKGSPQTCPPTDKGTCDYNDKTPKWPSPENKRGFSQVHHLLSVSPVNAYDEHSKADTIKIIYHNTEWCISHSDNLIRMPHKKYYLALFIKGGSKRMDPNQAKAGPCHDVDHHLYLKDVREKIVSDVWNQVGKIQEDGKCFNEKHAQAALKDLHNNSESGFRAVLAKRGKRGKGIPTLLAMMQTLTSYSEADLGEYWWFPFSMASDDDAEDRPIHDLYSAGKPPAAIKKQRDTL